MQFLTEQQLGNVLQRNFVLGEVPGVVWIPRSGPAPLVLLGHPGGLSTMHPRLLARAQHLANDGFASAALELPGCGERPRIAAADEARAELRRAVRAGEPVGEDVLERLVLPLVDQAAPEWQHAVDVLLQLPGITGPVGCAGGLIALGVRLAVVEPRIEAAVLFAGSYVPRVMFAEAKTVAIPLQVLLQWDDEGNDRQLALDLFDALGSGEKSLHANMGGHTGVPPFAVDDGARFFARHLQAG